MLGEVQYGGRVTDDYDKRLLNTYARVWFSEEMFLEKFKFYTGKFLHSLSLTFNIVSFTTNWRVIVVWINCWYNPENFR